MNKVIFGLVIALGLGFLTFLILDNKVGEVYTITQPPVPVSALVSDPCRSTTCRQQRAAIEAKIKPLQDKVDAINAQITTHDTDIALANAPKNGTITINDAYDQELRGESLPISLQIQQLIAQELQVIDK